MHVSRAAVRLGLIVAVLISAVSSSLGSVLFNTRFDGAAGRPPEWLVYNGTPDSWTLFSGQLQSGNGDKISVGDGRSYAVLGQPQSASWADYSISADVWMSQRNGTLGLVGRWQGTTQHYEGTIEVVENQRVARIERVASAAGKTLPERKVLAQKSALGDEIPNLAGGTTARDGCRLTLAFSGDQISLLVNGKLLVKATDGQIKAGSAGVLNYQNYAYFDNVTVETGQATGLAAVAPMATPSPRFTPAVMQTPAAAAPYGTINRPIPNSVLQNIDEAELVQRLTKEERQYYDHLADQDKVTLLRNLRTRLTSAAGGPANAEMAAQIEALKKQMEQLTSAQQGTGSAQDKAVSEALVSVEALQDQRNYTAALDKLNDLLKFYPGNAALLLKKRTLERLSAGSYDGYEEQLAKNETTVKRLQTQAANQEKEGSLESALMTWTTIIGMTPAKDEWMIQASARINALNKQIAAKAKERDNAISALARSSDNAIKFIARSKWFVYSAIAISIGIGLIVMVALRRFSKRSKARDEEILTQVKDLTQPLVDMQAEIRQLTGTGMLALPGDSGPRALPMSAESVSAPIVSKTASSAVVERHFDEEPTPLSGIDDLDFPEISQPAESIVVEQSKPKTPKPAVQPTPVPVEEKKTPVSVEFDPLAMNDSFDNLGFSANEPAEEADGESALDDLRMDDYNLGGNDLQGPDVALTAASGGSSIDLDSFSLQEGGSNPGLNPKSQSAGAGLVEPRNAAPVIDLAIDNNNSSLDLGLTDFLAPEPEGDSQTLKLTSPALDVGADDQVNVEYDPMANLGAADDFKLELMDDSAPDSVTAAAGQTARKTRDKGPEAIPIITTQPGAAAAATASAPAIPRGPIGPGIVYEQSFEKEMVGEMPAAWAGDQKPNVMFHVAESNGRRVLRYFKNAGTDSVHFFCRFPNVGGVVSIEFDINCPQKNKYLLGLYIERDGNYNQAIRTVVHCLDPQAASIRMQNEPVEYKLGEWRRVKYVVDLNLGTIDGYIDREQILTQQTFVNKPSQINTLSIRDNHATTGELLIGNIRIEKLS